MSEGANRLGADLRPAGGPEPVSVHVGATLHQNRRSETDLYVPVQIEMSFILK